MSTTLYTIGASHYCEKARWALDRAAVPYREVASAPFLHMLKTTRVRGRSVPILIVGEPGKERTSLYDSSDIVRFADQRLDDDEQLVRDDAPEATAFAAELDRSLGPHARAYLYQRLFQTPPIARRVMTLGTSTVQRRAVTIMYPVMSRLMKKGMRINAKNADKSHARLTQWFDTIAEQLDGRDYLFGDRFGVADLTTASLSGPLVVAPEYHYKLPQMDELPAGVAAELKAFQDHPAGQYVLRMFRDHRADRAAQRAA